MPSCRVVISSRKRVSCSASQSRSTVSGSVSQRELLVGREVAVADDGGRGDGEVDGAEQRVVELGLGLGEADRRRRGQADHVRVLGQLAEHGADDVAPQRSRGGGTRRAARRRRPASPAAARAARAVSLSRSRSSTPACSPRATSRLSAALIREQLARAAVGGRALERLALALRLLRRHAGGGRALVRPARLREPAEHDLRVLELAQRLVGEARDRLERVGAGDLRGRARELRRPRAATAAGCPGWGRARARACRRAGSARRRAASCPSRAARRCACACCPCWRSFSNAASAARWYGPPLPEELQRRRSARSQARRDRARGPRWSGGRTGSRSAGSRRASASTVCAECSRFVVLRLDRERLPHRRELLAACPAGTPSGPVMPCLSRNDCGALGACRWRDRREMPTTARPRGRGRRARRGSSAPAPGTCPRQVEYTNANTDRLALERRARDRACRPGR